MKVEATKVLARLRSMRQEAAVDHRTSCIVGFSASYAFKVHEDLQMYHKHGQAKYLEEPARLKRRELIAIVHQSLSRGVSWDQSLLLAGLRLQREAQQLAPVDTGALRNSAFTKLER